MTVGSAVERFFRRGGCAGRRVITAERRLLRDAIWADVDAGLIKLPALARANRMSKREKGAIGTAIDSVVARADNHTPAKLRMALGLRYRALMDHALRGGVTADIRNVIGDFLM